MIVEVSTPAALVMLPNFPVETVVGSYLKAAVTLKASTGDANYPNQFEFYLMIFFLYCLIEVTCHLQVHIFIDVMLLIPSSNGKLEVNHSSLSMTLEKHLRSRI